ncbi:MAG: GyrI-like domain-containing protein [Verrucomicrobiota bacterium]
MEKIDVKKQLPHLYKVSRKEVVEVNVPPPRYLMIDGAGDPNTSPAYTRAVEALFSVSYVTKFAVKRGPLAIDYGVMPLEGLWWADDWSLFEATDKSKWQWTMMILQPDFVPEEEIRDAIEQVIEKKGLETAKELRLEVFHEGRSAQILHVGPFSEEGPTIKRVHEFIDTRSSKRGKHHEIYLSDVRRAAPENWKTIIRQPME